MPEEQERTDVPWEYVNFYGKDRHHVAGKHPHEFCSEGCEIKSWEHLEDRAKYLASIWQMDVVAKDEQNIPLVSAVYEGGVVTVSFY